jgi:hypothetical protein
VRATAAEVLQALGAGGTRRVDWAPALPTLRALLDGTNLFAHNRVLDVLAATRIEPALAPPLLAGGRGELVLAKLQALWPAERRAARRLLVQLAGRDLGDDVSAWMTWVRALRSEQPGLK